MENREREFKRRKEEEGREGARKVGELERLKEEGRRMREERLAASNKAAPLSSVPAETAAPTAAANAATDLGPLDKTLKLKWLLSSHSALTSPASIESHLTSLLAPSPAGVESVVISSKTLAALSSSSSSNGGEKKKPSKYGTAVVSFTSLSAAVRVVKAARAAGKGKGWEGVEVSWAAGEAPEAVREELRAFERASGVVNGGEKVKKQEQNGGKKAVRLFFSFYLSLFFLFDATPQTNDH